MCAQQAVCEATLINLDEVHYHTKYELVPIKHAPRRPGPGGRPAFLGATTLSTIVSNTQAASNSSCEYHVVCIKWTLLSWFYCIWRHEYSRATVFIATGLIYMRQQSRAHLLGRNVQWATPKYTSTVPMWTCIIVICTSWCRQDLSVIENDVRVKE